ncbi:hydrolase-like protein [Cladorrhinum samala]|uniref:Hydrolase-like protein n=1 Tax=Cladorrhinum samala TaxID=585594 RepID=A0AAV9HDP3_9PEZI|nr:hydrolase-like protein [Cladorrhinum samala]
MSSPNPTLELQDQDVVPLQQQQQPTFQGRLKLADFMFKSTGLSASSGSPRRSPRFSLTPSVSDTPEATATPSPSLSARPSSPAKRSPPKRKAPSSPSTASSSSSSLSSPRKRTSSSSPRKRSSSSYAPPSTYAHLAPIPDAIAPNLLVFFIGLNPGIETARTGHAYAHPTNLFWRLLASSGITPRLCSPSESRQMPSLYSLGLTNIVSRPSRNGAELSRQEMDEGVGILEEKVRRHKPEVVCVVGKSIWESMWRVRHGKSIKKDEFKYGWQDETETMGLEEADGDDDDDENPEARGGREWKGARVFVATSTSGLAATLKPAEKEAIWKELGDYVVERRKERAEEAEKAAGGDVEVDGSTT